MDDRPLVSVITPTWRRRDQLFTRCIPSVQGQDYRPVEHVIVSDGPDPDLGAEMAARYLTPSDTSSGVSVKFFQLPDHDPAVRWGVRARLLGSDMAWGGLHAWLDDDNAWRPNHLSRLVAILQATPAAQWGYSRIQMNSPNGSYLVGSDPPVYGGIDTSAMIARREALTRANWRDEGQPSIDWDLAERWMSAGLPWAMDPEVTADYYMPGVDPRLVAGVTVRPLLGAAVAGESWNFTAAGHADDPQALLELLSEFFADPKHGMSASQFTGPHHNGPLHAKKKTAAKSSRRGKDADSA